MIEASEIAFYPFACTGLPAVKVLSNRGRENVGSMGVKSLELIRIRNCPFRDGQIAWNGAACTPLPVEKVLRSAGCQSADRPKPWLRRGRIAPIVSFFVLLNNYLVLADP